MRTLTTAILGVIGAIVVGSAIPATAWYGYHHPQYREFAEECDRLAKQAKTDGALEEMAEAWRMLI